MTLEKIRKMACKVSEEKSDEQKKEISNFLKSLYKQCVQVIENIPDDTINEIFERERTFDGEYGEVSAFNFYKRDGKAYIEIEEHYEDGGENVGETIKVESEFDNRGFCITIGINCIREETVAFGCDFAYLDSKYDFFKRLADEEFLNEFFGDFLEFNIGEFKQGFMKFGVNVKWFEEN